MNQCIALHSGRGFCRQAFQTPFDLPTPVKATSRETRTRPRLLPAPPRPPAAAGGRLYRRALIRKQRRHSPPLFRLRVETLAKVVALVLQQRDLFAQSVNLGL
jgi:hypothetical protein